MIVMSRCSSLFRQLYFKTTGYSFTHLGRLFMRMFVGLMLAQFGVRQLQCTDLAVSPFFDIPFVAVDLKEWLVIVVEIACPFFIMIGLFMRFMLIPPFILMLASCHHIAQIYGFSSPEAVQLLCVPFLFMGIFFFMLLVGPGKISVDYFYSLYLINRHQDKDREEDLEEV